MPPPARPRPTASVERGRARAARQVEHGLDAEPRHGLLEEDESGPQIRLRPARGDRARHLLEALAALLVDAGDTPLALLVAAGAELREAPVPALVLGVLGQEPEPPGDLAAFALLLDGVGAG